MSTGLIQSLISIVDKNISNMKALVTLLLIYLFIKHLLDASDFQVFIYNAVPLHADTNTNANNTKN